jgi:hypothetical protein
MAAQVKGRLILDDTGCLMLALEGIGYPVVWPAGTGWQPDPPAVVLPSGAIAEPGMSVLGEGGYMTSVANMAGREVDAAAAACAGVTGEIAIFNLGSTVEVTGP